MDFVVAGFGVGAILMLLGFAIRDVGPLRFRTIEERTQLHDEWMATCRSIGNVLVVGGLAICLATLISLLVGAGDATGSLSVMAIVAIAVIGCGLWSVLAIRRYVAVSHEMSGTGFAGARPYPSGMPSRLNRRPARPVRSRNNPVPVEIRVDDDVFDDDLTRPFEDVDIDQYSGAFDPRPWRTPIDKPSAAAPIADLVDDTETVEAVVTTTKAPVLKNRQQPTPIVSSEPDVEPDVEPTSQPAGRFASRLLADVEQEDDVEEQAPGFRSSLFAGIDQTRANRPDGGFKSSIFADLDRPVNGNHVEDEAAAKSATPHDNTSDDDDSDDDLTPSVAKSSPESEHNGEIAAHQRASGSGTEV